MSTSKTRDKPSVTPCGVFGLKAGSLAQKDGEDINAFMERVVEQAGEVLIKAEGSLDIAAVVFGCDTVVMKDIVKAYAILDEAAAEGRRIGIARIKGDDEVANAAQQRALNHVREVDNKIRMDLSRLDGARLDAALMAHLPKALRDYGGSETAIATALSLTVDEISSAIASSPELEEIQEKSFVAMVGRIEDHLFELAVTSQSHAPAVFVLKNLVPDKYSDKSTVEVSGFSAPPEVSELKSALTLVKKES